MLLYAKLFDDVEEIVSIAARFDMTQGIDKHLHTQWLDREGERNDCWQIKLKKDKQRRRVTTQDVEVRRNIDMKFHHSLHGTKCILIVHGTEDQTVPCEDARCWATEGAACDVKLVDGGNHNFDGEQRGELLQILKDFCENDREGDERNKQLEFLQFVNHARKHSDQQDSA